MAIYALGDSVPQLPAADEFWVAESAQVMGRVILERGASVWYGAILRGDNDPITIGENSNVQDGAVLHTDEGIALTVGRGVTIGHQAMLHGCTVGDGCLIGIGSTILNGAKIGRNCVIGSPGRVMKTLGPEMAELLAASADHYVANWKRHKRDLRRID